jgi:hypothetical protein
MDHSATSQLYFSGSNGPPFPGGLVPYRSLNGTPELAYGLTEWWELGFYAPFAVSNMGDFLSDGFKFRNLFVSPDAAKRDFFYGVNFEWSYTTPAFSQTRVGLEVRPIIGVRNQDWEFIVTPIIDFSIGSHGEADFAPCARLAKLGEVSESEPNIIATSERLAISFRYLNSSIIYSASSTSKSARSMWTSASVMASRMDLTASSRRLHSLCQVPPSGRLPAAVSTGSRFLPRRF